jgi:hypothetical protein
MGGLGMLGFMPVTGSVPGGVGVGATGAAAGGFIPPKIILVGTIPLGPEYMELILGPLPI